MTEKILRNKLLVLSILILAIWILAGILGPFLVIHKYNEMDENARYQSPSLSHPFGTDMMGRDMLSRVLFGARISLLVGVCATLISILIGVSFGVVSGYLGGRTDNLMMRVVDIIYGLPYIIFVIILMVLIGRGLVNIFIALGAVMWLTMARIVRGQVLSIKEREFILAAKALGVGTGRIIFRHILPNVLGIVIVYTALIVQEVILYEAFLSFIGIGVQPPMCSWGSLTKEGTDVIMTGNYLWLISPAICLCLTLLALNILSDRLRDRLDPVMKVRR